MAWVDDDAGHAGRSLEDRLALLLRHAPGDGDHRLPSLFGRQLAQFAQSRIELLFGAFAHAARVDDHQVGVGRLLDRLESRLLEKAGHPFRVVHVHLAAECLDEIRPAHGYEDLPCRGIVVFALSLSPFARAPLPCRSASISRADARTALVIDAPPSIRPSSSTRDGSSSGVTDVWVRPRSTLFRIRKWLSA
jgi:hypothetical protein